MPYQLNTLTGFSFYQSSVRIHDYALLAKNLGYQGIAINDDVLYGYPELAKECTSLGLKAIYGYRILLGCSFPNPFQASLYVLNEKGYRNLCQLLSTRQKEYGLALLAKYHEGLALVLHAASLFFSEAILTAASPDFIAYKKVFGEDFYFGIILSSKEDMEKVNILYDYAREYEYTCLAYPRVEYLRKSDAYIKNLLSKSKDFIPDNDALPTIEKEGPYFLLSPSSLETLYRKEDIQAVDTFVNNIDFTFFQKRGQLIHFDNEDETLKTKAQEGLKKKVGSPVPEVYQKRLDYELSVIRNMHFSSYFLIVQDYVNFAKNTGIKVGPGRGSAGGSLVAYALNITQIDPIAFDLTFERFLNPNRVTMPDIDVDFEDRRRNEVVGYLKKTYGEERVAEITTFARLKPKSALNLIGPVLGVKDNRLKKLTQSIPKTANTFTEAKQDPRFMNTIRDEYYRKLCIKANELLDLPINTSIHAAGIILSQDPLCLTCPRKEGERGPVGYEYEYMEKMGFLKVDILSLNNLTFISHIEEKIKKNSKPLPDIYHDLNNRKVYETLNNLDLVEIFQLDNSYGMKKTIQEIRPSCFSDLAACIALFRPGPRDYIPTFAKRKHGEEQVTYADIRLKPVLEETYGIMVYQEQIMKAVQVLAGFTLGEADLFRRAISKKHIEEMKSYQDRFIKGCIHNGIKEDKAQSIFSDIERFAQYGFNKSHAYAYGLITYTLLYYKTLYPEEFYLTTLESESFSSRPISDAIRELRRRGIKVRNPNINVSLSESFLLQDQSIYLPLAKCFGNKEILDKIIEERKKKPYSSYYEFLLRNHTILSPSDNKTVKDLETLIDAGAFDSLSKSRLAMKNNLLSYLGFAHFDMDSKDVPPLKDDGEDIGEMLYLEKMALGKILSCRLIQIFHKENYQTYIITDTSLAETSHIITIDNENQSYKITLPRGMSVHKYDFLLVKGEVYRSTLQVSDIINCSRKVVKHE